jgi:hypothetical protein
MPARSGPPHSLAQYIDWRAIVEETQAHGLPHPSGVAVFTGTRHSSLTARATSYRVPGDAAHGRRLAGQGGPRSVNVQDCLIAATRSGDTDQHSTGLTPADCQSTAAVCTPLALAAATLGPCQRWQVSPTDLRRVLAARSLWSVSRRQQLRLPCASGIGWLRAPPVGRHGQFGPPCGSELALVLVSVISAPRRGRKAGKPVRTRRCPATVMPLRGRARPPAARARTDPRRKGGSFRHPWMSRRAHFVLPTLGG